MVQFALEWEKYSTAGSNGRFGTGESNNQYLLVTSDREASNKTKIVFQVIECTAIAKWYNTFASESLFITSVSVLNVGREYSSILSSKVLVFFTSVHLSGKMWPCENLGMESLLERLYGVIFSPFCNTKPCYYIEWAQKDLRGAITRKGFSRSGETGFDGIWESKWKMARYFCG